MQLSRERLDRIFHILEQQGGEESIRSLHRNFSIARSEIKEAEILGWISTGKKKPKTGRPAIVARLSRNQPAKLPPFRKDLQRRIKYNHEKFARLTVYTSIKGGSKDMGFPGYVGAYQRTYPKAKSKNGAYASCSRLLRHPHVFAARQWYYATSNGEIPNLPCPSFESEIWKKLESFGSWRAKYRPTSRAKYREQRW